MPLRLGDLLFVAALGALGAAIGYLYAQWHG